VAQNPLRLLISLLAYTLADTGEHFLSYKKATTRFYEGPILKPPDIKKRNTERKQNLMSGYSKTCHALLAIAAEYYTSLMGPFVT